MTERRMPGGRVRSAAARRAPRAPVSPRGAAVRVQVRRAGATATAQLPSTRRLAQWASAALGRRGGGAAAELSVLLVGASASRALNERYRQRDHATNVLSFPATAAARAAGLLGDLVICPPLLAREAREQGKPLVAHWAHLVVHGVLHLIGFDHERTDEARRMQRREVRVLHALGFANPYRGD